MSDHLCISVRWLDARYHGRSGEGSSSEWPPSPLRLFQALVAGGKHGHWTEPLSNALRWLEAKSERQPPVIVAPETHSGRPYTLFVPNNDTDKPADVQRAAKIVRPTILPDDAIVHYVWAISPDDRGFAERVVRSSHYLTALGWGIDLAIADGQIVDAATAAHIPGVRWNPMAANQFTGKEIRVPIAGTLSRLENVYESFLNRLADGVTRPPLPFNVYKTISYCRADEPPARPAIVFELVDEKNKPSPYNHANLIHVAAWVRHVTIELTRTTSRFRDLADLVSGHADRTSGEFKQLSYLPLPSIGHAHTDPDVRRIMIAEPFGSSGEALSRLGPYIHGSILKPESHADQPDVKRRRLIRIDSDNVTKLYQRSSANWASVTPVILPGHDDHKPAKTRKLIEKALAQSEIQQDCTFEWNALSHFRKSLSAYKYNRNKDRSGYRRPEHLQNLTAVHLRLSFRRGLSGPLAIGAGRHCGLGIFAHVPETGQLALRNAHKESAW